MAYTYQYPHPAVTVDIAIFAFLEGTLKVLLVERAQPPFQGQWALPGGFVGLEESLKHAAWRELKEETGVHGAYFEQLAAFGHPKRDPRERVISVAYFALLPSDKAQLKAGSDAARAAWYAIDDTPGLAFDHDKILAKARQRVKEKLADATIALQLMPETFTMPELHQAFESILDVPLDKRNFSKQMLALRVIQGTGEKRRSGAHRPATIYRKIDSTGNRVSRK